MYQRKAYKRKRRQAEISSVRVFLRRFAPFIKWLSFIVVFAIAGYLLYGVYIEKQPLNITTAHVYGAVNFVDADDVEHLTNEMVLHENILFVDTALVKESLLNSFQGAKDIKISKAYPNRLEVDVFERIPMAIVTNPGSTSYFLVDEDGYILGQVEKSDSNLPIVTYSGELQIGQFIDRNLVPLYLAMVSTMEREDLRASSISVHDSFVKFYLLDVVEVYIGIDKDLVKAIEVVSEFYKQQPNLIEDVKRIDLRYDKVIVEYESQ